jgi:hypothetical protein
MEKGSCQSKTSEIRSAKKQSPSIEVTLTDSLNSSGEERKKVSIIRTSSLFSTSTRLGSRRKIGDLGRSMEIRI